MAILSFEARLVLKKYKPKIIAVTGSVGKTSTKDAIYTVLAKNFFVRKSEKSFNSEIGVPLTVLGLPNAWSNPFLWLENIYLGLKLIFSKVEYPAILVLEVGADRPGDIESITKWLKPDIAVVTRFGKTPVHVEFFASREAVIREKRFLVEALGPEGVAVLNWDDEDIQEMAKNQENKVVSYGLTGGTITADEYKILTEASGKGSVPYGISFMARTSDDHSLIKLSGSIGRQHVYPVLAALAVGSIQGLKFADMAASFEQHEFPRARMRLIEGLKGSMLIDDTYNASPVAVEEALKTLEQLPKAHRKIAVLGDMMELGKFSSDAHREVGVRAAKFLDVLVTVGFRSRKIAESALDAGLSEKNIYQFDSSSEAGAFLQNHIHEGDVILLKGSQSTRMERAVKEIMAHPDQAEKLLVRQDEEWLKR